MFRNHINMQKTVKIISNSARVSVEHHTKKECILSFEQLGKEKILYAYFPPTKLNVQKTAFFSPSKTRIMFLTGIYHRRNLRTVPTYFFPKQKIKAAYFSSNILILHNPPISCDTELKNKTSFTVIY